MLHHLAYILQIIITLFRHDPSIYIENLMLKKENEILKRKVNQKRFQMSRYNKFLFVMMNLVSDIKNKISLFKPESLLLWQKKLIKSFWTFAQKDVHPGRPPVPASVKNLVLEMKNNNLFWGAKRIRDELLKLDIDIHKKTVQNILKDFRRRGKIRKTLTWKKFLKSNIDSIFAMDFFTVDTLFNQRFYVFFIICHKTREIVRFSITQNPILEFVKQQIIEFEETLNKKVFLLHDRDPAFMSIDYLSYGIKNVVTSVKAPNMNAIAERFVRSIRTEALDNFLLINQSQILKIITEYVKYYNSERPHQGIDKIPLGEPPDRSFCSHNLYSNVKCKSVLGGLHHHYFKEAT